jgi:hypothetical protein
MTLVTPLVTRESREVEFNVRGVDLLGIILSSQLAVSTDDGHECRVSRMGEAPLSWYTPSTQLVVVLIRLVADVFPMA